MFLPPPQAARVTSRGGRRGSRPAHGLAFVDDDDGGGDGDGDGGGDDCVVNLFHTPTKRCHDTVTEFAWSGWAWWWR